MNNWQRSVLELQQSGTPAVLVSVDSIRGSTPREVGARMIVTEDNMIGTIGGGNLEYQSIAIAREQLRLGTMEEFRRFPLGAGLGQCCGGVVNLMFERLDENSNWQQLMSNEPLTPLILFGAGHVGRAVVGAFQGLPFSIRWIDTRDDIFPPDLHEDIETIVTDTPESEIDLAPPDSYFLVMTHDHQLDLALSEQILKRDDFSYFGLIGSQSKRRSFERRMKQRGMPESRLSAMTCPIGIDGISGKQPQQIAISVVAQILCRYDASVGRTQKQDESADKTGNVA